MKFFTEYKSCYGLAIDIGTTVVEMQLIDLENDMIIADYKKKNTQNIYGADIVSRINYAQSKIDGLARLQRRIIDMLNYMIKNIVENINIDRNMIGKTVIVGNYAMTSLFLGIPPEEISKIPSERCMQDEIVIDSEKIGLDISKSGKIIVLPGIAGFIGSDTMGVL